MEKDKNEQADVTDRIAGFLQTYRKPLVVLLVLIAVDVTGSIAFFLIRGLMEKKAIAAVEVLERKKNELGLMDNMSKTIEIMALLDEFNDFAPSTFGYAAARAYSSTADIYYSLGEWDKAEEAWDRAARKAPKIYLAPLALFNAAVAAEEQGKLEAAVDYYSRSLEFSGIFPAAARARFNVGRIHEAQNNRAGAIEAYRALAEKNPNSNWAKLAQSRLIVLEME
jgi:tetratricopeptide (TPR) repeat protein